RTHALLDHLDHLGLLQGVFQPPSHSRPSAPLARYLVPGGQQEIPMRSLTTLCAILAAALCALPAHAEPPPITLESLLKEMVDRDAAARFPDPAYTCKQFSSYDRRSTTPDNPD